MHDVPCRLTIPGAGLWRAIWVEEGRCCVMVGYSGAVIPDMPTFKKNEPDRSPAPVFVADIRINVAAAICPKGCPYI